jgi:hypothetical protein
MAPSATARRPARGRLTLGKPKGGPQPVGAAATRKPRPNRALLAVLGVVALAAVGRLAMPSMFGGGGTGVSSFSVPLTNRHFLVHAPTTTVPAGATGASSGRPSRDPFSAPPGYGS